MQQNAESGVRSPRALLGCGLRRFLALTGSGSRFIVDGLSVCPVWGMPAPVTTGLG